MERSIMTGIDKAAGVAEQPNEGEGNRATAPETIAQKLNPASEEQQ
jgi:hypothetical protein